MAQTKPIRMGRQDKYRPEHMDRGGSVPRFGGSRQVKSKLPQRTRLTSRAHAFRRAVSANGGRTNRGQVKGMGPSYQRKPIIRGGMPVPAGALGAALSIGRTVLRGLRGSPTTGPTKIARISQAAAGPISGVRTNKPKPISSRPRRGGNARLA